MPKRLFTAFILLLPFFSPAQPKEIILTGTLDVNTGEAFPYKIVVTEKDGIIKGYSFTYKEPDDTKAAITGTLDRGNHTLSFKETDIVYSHSFHTKAFMCLINAHLEYVQGGSGNVLQGPITSREADKTSCTGGAITFSNDAEIQDLFGYHEKFDTVISMKKKVKAPVENSEVKSVVPVPVTEKITTGIVKTFEWHSDTVVIDVWDGGNVDGDRITLEYNGKKYLTNYYLLREKKHLRIPVSAHGIDSITITADNEGSEPPNTANLLLTDGATQYSILAYNNKGNQCVIKIKKVK